MIDQIINEIIKEYSESKKSKADVVRKLAQNHPDLSRQESLNIYAQALGMSPAQANTYYYNYGRIIDNTVVLGDVGEVDELEGLNSNYFSTDIVRNSLKIASDSAKYWYENRTFAISKDTFKQRGGLSDSGKGSVYVYYKGKEALYVGLTARNVKSRMHTKTSPHKDKEWWSKWDSMRFLQLEDEVDRQLLEYLLIVAYTPEWNTKPRGKDLSFFLPD
ncbi:hypothetical protein [Colwellia piezophila]|uniref:hypothetical protein n=1 Tax=Colwellia piezophila TaxID=211668 RepID=UPI0003714586|nr:hypothetical protein [Colwellia piezophila]